MTNQSAGDRLIEELSKPDDPYSMRLLIEEAGQCKDFLDRLRPVLNGDESTWLEVKIGAKTVQVSVTNVLTQYRQLTEQLRRLLSEIHRQRAANPGGSPDEDGDPTKV